METYKIDQKEIDVLKSCEKDIRGRIDFMLEAVINSNYISDILRKTLIQQLNSISKDQTNIREVIEHVEDSII